MHFPTRSALFVLFVSTILVPAPAEDSGADEKMLRAIYTAALTNSPAYEQLRELTTKYPGRLGGSKNLAGAVQWGQALLQETGVDRTELQSAVVPHWERGATESVRYYPQLGNTAIPLTAIALGGSVPTPVTGLRASVIELHTLAELKTADVKGKI
ncbi:MAG: peptidase M28 family protein, partial [Opitutaceae bacterium]|nr:peptidase M28 family protein [Opitutaceae bacterium]